MNNYKLHSFRLIIAMAFGPGAATVLRLSVLIRGQREVTEWS